MIHALRTQTWIVIVLRTLHEVCLYTIHSQVLTSFQICFSWFICASSFNTNTNYSLHWAVSGAA